MTRKPPWSSPLASGALLRPVAATARTNHLVLPAQLSGSAARNYELRQPGRDWQPERPGPDESLQRQSPTRSLGRVRGNDHVTAAQGSPSSRAVVVDVTTSRVPDYPGPLPSDPARLELESVPGGPGAADPVLGWPTVEHRLPNESSAGQDLGRNREPKPRGCHQRCRRRGGNGGNRRFSRWPGQPRVAAALWAFRLGAGRDSVASGAAQTN